MTRASELGRELRSVMFFNPGRWGRLGARRQVVLACRCMGWTQGKIGLELGVTAGRIGQIEKDALRRMKIFDGRFIRPWEDGYDNSN